MPTLLSTHTLPIICFLPDSPYFTITNISTAYSELTGMHAAAMLGKSFFDPIPDKSMVPNPFIRGLQKSLDKVIRTGQADRIQIQCHHSFANGKDNSTNTYCIADNIPVFNNKGELTSIVHSLNPTPEMLVNKISEIEKHRLDDLVLKRLKSENYFRQIAETAQEGIWVVDQDERTIFINAKLCEILDSSPHELMSKNICQFINSEPVNNALAKIENRKQEIVEPQDCMLTTKSGKKIWVTISTKPVLDAERKFAGVIAMITDINERKKTEQEMVWLINNTEECFILLNHDLKIVSFNKQFEDLYARYLKINIVKGDSILDYAQPERREIVKDIYQRVLKGAEEKGEIAIPITGGMTKFFAIKYKPAKNESGVTIGAFVSATDITEKKDAEKQQLFDRRDTEALINTTGDLMWSVNSNFKLIAANDAFVNELAQITGISLEAGDEVIMEGKFPAQFLALWKDMYNRALAGESFIQEIYTPATGAYPETWAETRFNPIYEGVKISGIACYSRNTTESKSFRNKLIAINKKLEAAQQTAQLGYWEHDVNMNALYWSDEVYRIWGVSPGSFMPGYKYFYDSIHPADRKIFDAGQKLVFEGRGKLDVEHRIILEDGSIKYVHEKGQFSCDGNGARLRFEGTVQDITKRKKAENKIKESELRYRSLIEQATDAICIADQGLKFVDMNPQACRMFGYSKEEFQDLTLQDILLEDDSKENHLKIEEVKSGKTVRNERRLKRKDGTIVVMEVSTKMMTDGNYIMFGHDVTERKKAEEETKRLTDRLLMATSNAGMGIWDWDMEKNHLDWDEGMYKLYDMDSCAFKSVEEGWLSRVHPEDKSRISEHIQMAIADKKEYDTEFRIIWDNLSVHYIRATGIIERDEVAKAIRMIGLNWDNTERRLSEINMGELNRNIQKHAKKLAESNAELEQFAYVASHDLQEPLRMVTSYLTQLEKKYADVLDEKGMKYIHFAVDGAKRMRQIILDLLEFSRVGRTDDSLEMIDLNGLVHEIETLFTKQISEKGAIIAFKMLPFISSHRAPLRQVFQNLIGNALKYTRKNTPVHIQITAVELENEWQFAITDNGIGIDDEYFEKVFVIFQRLHNKTEFSGTGIGLAVTKKIIEKMGGRIWITSTEGLGSTFSFTLSKQQAR